jgi:thioredoxin-like negative regulator of GroEL
MIYAIYNIHQWNATLANSTVPIVVKCGAKSCKPCIEMDNPYNKMAETYKDHALFLTVDVDEVDEFAELYEISAVPSVLLIHQGVVLKKTYTLYGLESALHMVIT